jgi:hypothetical protein
MNESVVVEQDNAGAHFFGGQMFLLSETLLNASVSVILQSSIIVAGDHERERMNTQERLVKVLSIDCGKTKFL